MFDLRDLMLKAAADVQKAVMTFGMEVDRPIMISQAAQMWMQLPNEMKEKFKSEKPEEYAAFMKELQK